MRRNNTIKDNIVQFVLIVFSVVLGVYLSERIEERKNRKESEGLLNTIKSEVKDNIKLLEYWHPYHQEIYKNLDSLSQDEAFIEEFINDKSVIFDRLFTRGTFMGRMPADDAWDIAKSHPLIVNIDYDKLLVLFRIYSQQEVTFEPAQKMFDLFFSKDINLEKDAKQNLELVSNHIRELVALEQQLIFYYKKGEEAFDLKAEKEVDK